MITTFDYNSAENVEFLENLRSLPKWQQDDFRKRLRFRAEELAAAKERATKEVTHD